MAIEALEQKTGHWVDVGEREPWFRCSACGNRAFGSYHKYCSNCGTKMNSENEA